MRLPHRSRASTTVTPLPARPKLTGSHQARSARADDHELAANECQVHAAPVEWPRSAAAPAGSNQEKLGGKAMTEKTVRPHSVLRRRMLVGTAGVLGGAVLRSTPVQSQTGTAPAVAVPGSAPPAARYGDPAWRVLCEPLFNARETGLDKQQAVQEKPALLACYREGINAARVRLIVWCEACQHQVEPEPA